MGNREIIVGIHMGSVRAAQGVVSRRASTQTGSAHSVGQDRVSPSHSAGPKRWPGHAIAGTAWRDRTPGARQSAYLARC